MDTKELVNKIAKLKNAIDSESDPDVKKAYQKKVDALEKQIAEAEVKVEKVEAKAAAEEKKDLNEAEQKISKLKAALASESDPDVKERYQKKIKQLEETLKDVKQEIKEEKKEIAEQKKDIKVATKEVKSAQKEVRKTAIKKVAAKQVERKQVVTRKAKRKTKIKSIISDLDALINKNKELKAKYKGKGVDLKRDAGRSAKPFGYRFVGKYDYRVPTEAQVRKGLKRGTIDYEGRPNRSDKYPKGQGMNVNGGYAKLADGGMMAKSGNTHMADGYNRSSNLENISRHLKDRTKVEVGSEEISLIKKRKEKTGYPVYVIAEGYAPITLDVYETKDLANKKAEELAKKEGYKFAKGGELSDRRSIVLKIAAMMRSYFKLVKNNESDYGYEIENYSEFNDLESGDFDIMQIVKGNDTLTIEGDDEFETKYITLNGKKYQNKDLFKEGDKYFFIGYDKTFTFKPNGDEGALWGVEGKLHDISTMYLYPDLFIYMFDSKKSWDDFDSKMAKGGTVKKKPSTSKPKPSKKVGKSVQDKHRYAKPAGWRWKEEAVTKRVIERKQLSMQPSKKMRDKHPDLVYYEDRLNKADQHPTRTSADSI